MKFKLLGRTGLRVSELCLGAMTFGNGIGWGSSKDESRAVFDTFVEAGGNFIDTADVYQGGSSEEMLGEFVRERRHAYVLATKYSMGGQPGDPNATGNHRKSMVQALEGSLRRLGTDYVDLYWVHAWDGITPADEVMRALDDMVRAGKILHIGFSDTPAWVVARSQMMAELRGWTSIAAIQFPYSLVERGADQELLPMARALGLTMTVWASLASGLLSGKYNRTDAPDGRLAMAQQMREDGRAVDEARYQVVDLVRQIAQSHGASPAHVALAWVRARDPGIIPLLGTRSAAQLKDNLACLDLHLTADEVATLNAATAIDFGCPGDLLQSPVMQRMVFGGNRERIEAPQPYR